MHALTLGGREKVHTSRRVGHLIDWAWWCSGLLIPLRLIWLKEAGMAARLFYLWEVGVPDKPKIPGGYTPVPLGDGLDPKRKERPIQGTACEFAVIFGGTASEWRKVRWRDARYMWDFHAWRETPMKERKQEKAPVWGKSNG